MRRGLPKEMSLDSPISLSMLFHARASKANRFWSEQPGRLADIGTFSCSSDLGPWVCIALCWAEMQLGRCVLTRSQVLAKWVDDVDDVDEIRLCQWLPMYFWQKQITNLLGTFAGVGACKHMFGSWFFCVVLSRCGNPVWECWAPKCLSGLWAKIVKAALDVMDLAPSGTKLERGKEVMTRYLQLQEFSIMCYSWTHVCKTGMEGIGW